MPDMFSEGGQTDWLLCRSVSQIGGQMNAPETLLPEKIGVYADGADLRLKLTDILAHGVTRYIRSDLIPRWVSVEDELPEKNGTYFCLRNGVGQCLGAWFIPLGSVEASYGGYFGDAEITHWLKGVPPIPKEK